MLVLSICIPSVTSAASAGCFDLTSAQGLRSARILDGLGLPGDQARELKSRLASYNSVRGFAGLDGIGLTPEQIIEIQRRIDLQVAAWKPLGYPCVPFKNRAKVIALVKQTLVYNGFRPSITVTNVAPRQVQMRAVRDGWNYLVVVAKTGARQVMVTFAATQGTPLPGGVRIATPFVS